MRFTRTTATLATALLVASMSGCAELTTTGVPADEEPESEMAHSSEGNELSGTSWVLAGSALSERGAGRAEITADFFAEQLSGRAHVNSYFAPYEVEGESIEIGEVGATLMAGPAGLMTLETEYFELLSSVDSYRLAEDTLVLLADEVDVLEFEPADTPEAEGAAAPGGADVEDDEIVGVSIG